MKTRTDALSGKNYKKQLHSYLQGVNDLHCSASLPDRRLEHQFECLNDWSQFHSEKDIKDWFMEMRRDCPMQVDEIPLNQVRNWHTDQTTGNINHQSGDFFQIHGVRINESNNREVGSQGWDQPILTQVGYDGGLLGILSQRFDNIPHYLIEAKAEPGNYKIIQLSPTLQATFSNLKQAHAGRKPHFSHFFETPENNQVTILYKQWLSEDGGRFYQKRNMGMLIEIPSDTELKLPNGFIWMSMFQIKSLLMEDAWVNPHIRGIIAHL